MEELFWQLIWWATLGATLVQLAYWLLIFSRLAFYKLPPEEEIKDQPPVSVVICARNEAKNLSKNLDRFLNQNYRCFEIIVTNDNSTDNTAEILLEFQAKSPILRVVNLFDFTPPGKKAALERGIQEARYDIVLLSDADCAPASDRWIAEMQGAIRSPCEIALGYSPYQKERGILNAFIRFETIYTAIQYLSFSIIHLPYMGVGRNLAYRKSLFQKTGGFESHAHIASGDDDLFINAAANSINTKIILRPGAFVFSEPKHTWRGYYHQKSRHLTTGRRYRVIHQLLLGGLSASHALHYLGIVTLLFRPALALSALFFYVVRIGVVALLYRRILVKLQDPGLRPWVPCLDAAFVLFYLLFAPALITGKQKRWN